MPVFQTKLSTFEHAWETTRAAVALCVALPGWQPIYEREIRQLEADENTLIASAKVGRNGARSMFHRPDLALVAPSGRTLVVEVELTPKDLPRLTKICRGWAWARHVDQVYYLATPKPHRATTRVVQAVKAQNKIIVLELDDTAGIVERELAREEAQAHRQIQH